MKVFYTLGMAVFLMSCSKPQNPDELFLAAKEKLYKAARVEFRQTLIFETPNMGEFDTALYSVDFRKNPEAVLGYDFKGKERAMSFGMWREYNTM